ncbi:MAG: hypothetical protein HZB12_00305 [Candidatus Yonathbacteria bacterium]|nr:hypothetical protein [Candidatus Yonathbacteria bacterium]
MAIVHHGRYLESVAIQIRIQASYFDSITNGWIDYSHNHTLVKLFSLALNSPEESHREANVILQKGIDKLKKK